MSRLLFINIRSYNVERVSPLYAAKDLGHKVVLMCDKVPEFSYNLQHLVDDYIVTDTFNIQEALNKVIEYNKNQKIDAVLTWIDKDVELVALVGEALGIKSLSVDASQKVRNKYLMRKSLGEDSQYCPKFKEINNFDDLQNGIKYTGLPAILKPVGASGSNSIYLINNEFELDDIFCKLINSTKPSAQNAFSYFPNKYILEEYMVGDEISIDGFINNGKIFICGVVDKEVTPDYSLEFNALFPSKYSQILSNEIIETATNVIQKLELDNCPFHLECKISNGKIKVIEIAGRCGGGFITSHLISLSRKKSLHQAIINNALDNIVDYPSFNKPVVSYYGMVDPIINKSGIIKQLPNINLFYEDNRILYVLPKKLVGDYLSTPPDNFHPNLGAIIVKENNYDLLQKLLQEVSLNYINNVILE